MNKKNILLVLFCFMLLGLQCYSADGSDFLNSKGFKKRVWDYSKSKKFQAINDEPVLIEFYAGWCGTCVLMKPNVDALKQKYKGKMQIYHIDVDQEPELATLFNIQAYPAYIFIGTKNKSRFFVELGYRDYRDLEKLTQKYLFSN